MGWYLEGGAGEANELQELNSCPGERVAGGGSEGGGSPPPPLAPWLSHEPWLLPLLPLQVSEHGAF